LNVQKYLKSCSGKTKERIEVKNLEDVTGIEMGLKRFNGTDEADSMH